MIAHNGFALRLAITASLVVPGPLLAQSNPANAKIAEFGGAMHAGARACFHYSEEELRKLKAQQKQQALAAQMREADFEAAFQAGYVKTRDRLAKASAAEKKKACDQLASIGGLKRKP